MICTITTDGQWSWSLREALNVCNQKGGTCTACRQAEHIANLRGGGHLVFRVVERNTNTFVCGAEPGCCIGAEAAVSVLSRKVSPTHVGVHRCLDVLIDMFGELSWARGVRMSRACARCVQRGHCARVWRCEEERSLNGAFRVRRPSSSELWRRDVEGLYRCT